MIMITIIIIIIFNVVQGRKQKKMMGEMCICLNLIVVSQFFSPFLISFSSFLLSTKIIIILLLINTMKKKRRIGRGIGSSKGKTSGRGHKGQKARSGGSIPLGFEGGQTKFYKLLPKRGFTNKRHKANMVPINIGTIQDYIDMGRLHVYVDDGTNNNDTNNNNHDNDDEQQQQRQRQLKVLTMKDFCNAGMCHPTAIKHGMKLLSKGKERLRIPIQLEISRASHDAIEAVESIGGEVTTVHYNQLALRALLRPEKFLPSKHVQHEPQQQQDNDDGNDDDEEDDIQLPSTEGSSKKKKKKPLPAYPKFARPPPKWQPYYTNWERNRGYLSVQAQMRNLLKHRPDLEDAFSKSLEEKMMKMNNNNDNEQ